MNFTLLLVAFNLGTIIVLILAVLFFGGIIFLASHSRTESTGSEADKPAAVPSKVTPLASPMRPAKWNDASRQTPMGAALRDQKSKKGLHHPSRA